MKRTRHQQRWILGAALAALAAAPAMGQVRSNQDGRAMDANTRVGSGGYNSGSNTGQVTATPNQIVYGDVTGGKQFRGPTIERDPGAFTGPTGSGLVDRFNAGTSGIPLAYQPSFTLSTPQPFFGDSRAVAPPPGSVPLGFTGSYLGTSLMPTAQRTGWSSEYFNNNGNWQTTQSLSTATVVGTNDRVLSSRSGETLILQGPPGSQNQGGLLSGSPLYGVQPITPGEGVEGDIGPNSTNGAVSPFSQLSPDRFQFDAAELRRMRSELQPNNQQPNEKQEPAEKQNENGAPKLGQPLEAPENQPLGSHAIPSLQSSAIEADGVNTGQGIQRRLTVNLPRQQSEQYNELQRRLARYENPQVAAIQANIDFQRDLRKLQTASAPGHGPTSRPAPQGIASAPRQTPGGAAPEPLRINSLAAGIHAKGLHDLLASAEELMRQGKFESAIEKYNMAEQVAPDEHLIPLGRANAELGAGYYRLAASDLHRVFLSDPALVLGQYDLTQWIPSQRLQYISKELQTLAASEPQQETPVFLLAYVSYNSGHATDAAKYLGQAQQRAGTADPLLSMLKSHWKLPATATPSAGEQLNK